MIEAHQEQYSKAIITFNLLERELRYILATALSRCFGTNWVNNMPETVLEKIIGRKHEALETDGPMRGENLLNHSDFSELEGLIFHHWEDGVKDWFESKETTQIRLKRVRLYRNALMHSDLAPHDCDPFINICEKLLNRLKEGSKTDKEPPPKVDAGKPKTILQQIRPATINQVGFSSKVSQMLEQMSGYFEGERDALLSVLELDLAMCTSFLAEEIRLKFKELPDTNRIIERFIDKLPPAKPKPPGNWQEVTSLNHWIRWATKEYIPYRYWTIIHEQEDEDIEAMSLSWEDWLFENYPKLLQENSSRLVNQTCDQHIVKMLDKNKTVLWVIIDNLPWYYSKIITEHLPEKEFKDISVQKQIALLPSETATSRVSALTGQLPSELPDNINWQNKLIDNWNMRTNKKVELLADIRSLNTIDTIEADLFIFVFGRLDKLSHEPNTKDFDRAASIEGALRTLMARVTEAVQLLSNNSPTMLVISTDHGATFLSQKSKRIAIPPSITKQEGFERHKRFVRTDRPDSLNDEEWFFLDKEKFSLPASYGVTRGWRYIDKRPRGFTHGGLSPEETILPIIICEYGKSDDFRLHPLFEQATPPARLGVSSKFAIRVRNPFRVPIEDMEIKLVDFGVVFPPIDIQPQQESTTGQIDLKIPAKTSAEEDTISINLFVRFTKSSKEQFQDVRLKVKVRQLFKTDLDDGFGEMFE